jgi:hypothetical protein
LVPLLPRAAISFQPGYMGNMGSMGTRVAIVSQEDAAVWVGKFDWEVRPRRT